MDCFYAANADRLAFQRRLVANLDGGVKAIHVEMDDGANGFIGSHEEILHQGAALSKPPAEKNKDGDLEIAAP
jgi:hypothetical protein